MTTEQNVAIESKPENALIWGGVEKIRVSEAIIVSRYDDGLRKRHIRIDGRGDSWRVDISDFVIWVAIDYSEGFATFEQAKVYAEDFVAMCREQGTFEPRDGFKLRLAHRHANED